MSLKDKFSKLEAWQKNLVVLWIGTFMTGVGFSLIAPFLSLYIDTLGHYSKSELNIWSGTIYASTFLMTAIVSPFWGRLADQKGRKLMLLRASLGMGIAIFLMGFATTAWHLLALRLLLGAFSGFISNSITLMATSTPREKSGQVLSLLTTGSVSGTLLGPIIGGIIVSHTSYRVVFFITGIIMILVFVLTKIMVVENFTPVPSEKMMSFSEVRRTIKSPFFIVGLLLTTIIVQITNQSISPILSLYVRELMHNTGNITFMSGLVASAPGITNLLMAPYFGRLGDKIGQKKVLLTGLVASFVFFVLMGFTQNIYQVIMLRLCIGISDAAIFPSVLALLSINIPGEIKGRVFSYNQSAQSLGAVTGPLIGSAVAVSLDYRYVFLVSSVFIVVNIINNAVNERRLKLNEEMSSESGAGNQ